MAPTVSRNGRASSQTAPATIVGPLTTRDPRLLAGRQGHRVDPFTEIGTTGLKQYGGFVLEEWLSQLQGKRAAWVWREMADNSAVIGAIMFAIRMLARNVDWRVECADDQVIPRAKMTGSEFVESCMGDMSHTWGDFVSEALSFLQYGWSYHEEVHKLRNGELATEPPLAGEGDIPETQEDDAPASSKYDDGLIGWRKLPIRAQETLLRWRFRGYAGLLAMEQVDWHGGQHVIPIEKALLFRTEAARGNPEGRALALDTLVPTPGGWKTMAELYVGSKVFDDCGKIRYVTAVADWKDRPCYRVTFADGTSIVADENHSWLTQTVRERSLRLRARERSTGEIAASTHNSQGISQHGIRWAAPLDYPEQHLAIDPYVLGLWLGDGSATSGRITCHADDVEEQAVLIGAAGYEAVERQNGRAGGKGRVLDLQGERKWVNSPQRALRGLGVLENKHIPAHYLRGSADQRLALLQGLMDSDGHCDVKGRCEFVNTNRRLIDGCAELVRSLGVGCRVALRHRAGEPCGDIPRRHDSYSVKFTPPFAPFRLERKAARAGKSHRRPFNYIVGCERIENRRTRCIEVDGPSHLFLAGEAMVPTHNSILRSAYQAYYYMQNIQTDEAIGISRDLAGIPKATAPDGVDIFAPQHKELLERVKELVTSIEKDEQQGIVMPPGWVLELMKTGGSRQVDTDPVLRRYRQEIAASVLADFILVGLDDIGSYAMVDVKAELFGIAVDSVLDMLCEVMNRYAIPRLFRLNGFQVKAMPRIKHSSAGRIDLEKVGNFLYHLAGAGAPIPWSNELLEQLFGEAGLPANFPGETTEEVHKAEGAIKLDVVRCARCGENHGGVSFAPLLRPVEQDGGPPMTHWAICPATGEPIMMHTAEPLSKADNSAGAMVALYPSPEVAGLLAQPGGEPGNTLHVTLAYLGDAASLMNVEALRAVVQGIAASSPPVLGAVSGIGHFTAGPEPVTYASVDAPTLPALRERLVGNLDAAGFPLASEHGFTPHITLAYDDRDLRAPNCPLAFGELALVVGGRVERFPLRGVAKAQEADEDGVVNVSPALAARRPVLAMQLEHEIGLALGHLGEEAATAYMTVAQKASVPGLQALVQRVLSSLNIASWISQRLQPLLRNHAGRVAGDTQRTLQHELGIEVKVGVEAVQGLEAQAGRKLRVADIEPQVREAITRAIEEGLKAGDNPIKTAQRIKESVPPGRFVHAGSQYRSRLIARQETAHLQRMATLAAYEANPRIESVRVRDGIFGEPRSDEECIDRSGETIPLEEAAVLAPELHIQCTVSYDPIVSADAAVPSAV